MKELKESFLVVLRSHKSLFILMLLLFFVSIFLCIFSLSKIDPQASVVKIKYGDIGGYENGDWSFLISFPLFSLLFGVLHNFFVLRVFREKGEAFAKVFVIVSLFLLIGVIIILTRLLKEM